MKVLRWFATQWLVSVTLLLYLWASMVSPEKTLNALQSGGSLLLSVALLIIAVMGLVGFVQVWISRDAVAGLLGKEGGIKSLLIATLCGTLLIGPPYIIFPLLMAVRKLGARWAVVAIVLAAYAVKLPMIPLEVGFLGWPFSLGRSFLTLLFAIPTGLLVERLMPDADEESPRSKA